MAESEQLFRVIIVGDTGVGKSCFLLRFTENRFTTQHNITIGVEFGAKTINVDGQLVKLQIWDTAGQESFRSITRSFYRKADGVLLMFDVTAEHTFANCTHWIEEVRENSPADVVIYLVGNQVDLEESSQYASCREDREVTAEQAQSLVRDEDLAGYQETSAKTGLNVDLAFLEFAQVLLQRRAEKAQDALAVAPKVDLHLHAKPKRRCC